MRRNVKTSAKVALFAAASLSFVSLSASSAIASDQIFRVDLNKTQIVRLPSKANSIVVGNPAIADISVQSPDTIFVIGRGYGETNLIVLDRNGRTMMDADIQVTAVTPSHGVRVFNGGVRKSYSCAPYCQPSPILGDAPEFIGANSGQAAGGSSPTLFDEVLSMPSNPLAGPGGGDSPRAATQPTSAPPTRGGNLEN